MLHEKDTHAFLLKYGFRTTTTTPPPPTDDPIYWICPEDYDGLIRHPYDCRFFYNCDPARRPCLFECPDDLYFNPVSYTTLLTKLYVTYHKKFAKNSCIIFTFRKLITVTINLTLATAKAVLPHQPLPHPELVARVLPWITGMLTDSILQGWWST